jgi:hypothetical protein
MACAVIVAAASRAEAEGHDSGAELVIAAGVTWRRDAKRIGDASLPLQPMRGGRRHERAHGLDELRAQ